MSLADTPVPTLTTPARADLRGVTGRTLVALPFVVFGALHLVVPGVYAAYVPAWAPGGGLAWVVLTGVALLVGGVLLALGRRTTEAAALLALNLVVFVVVLHVPGALRDGLGSYAYVSLLKDLGLLGALLPFFGPRD